MCILKRNKVESRSVFERASKWEDPNTWISVASDVPKFIASLSPKQYGLANLETVTINSKGELEAGGDFGLYRATGITRIEDIDKYMKKVVQSYSSLREKPQ